VATHVKRSIEVAVPVRAAHGQWTVGPRSPRVLDDPASGVLTGYPGARIGHTETGGQGVDDTASGVLTGYPGDRTGIHLHAGTCGLDDPAAGVLAGYPGARVDHTGTGGQSADDPAAGVLTGYPLGSTGRHVETGTRGANPGTDDGEGRP
jgi:hypothetical protein